MKCLKVFFTKRFVQTCPTPEASLVLSYQSELTRDFSRVKRQDQNYYQSAQCVQNCQLRMMNQMGRVIPDPQVLERVSSGSMTVNTTVFDGLCTSYKDGKNCIDNCQDSTVKSAVQGAYYPITKLCIDQYEEFREQMPCFLRIEREIDRTCVPKCGPAEAVQQRARSGMQSVATERDVQRIQGVLDDLCTFMECQIECQSPIVKRECGDRADELLTSFYGSSASSMQKTLAQVDGDALQYWPESCKRMAAKGCTSLIQFSSFVGMVLMAFLSILLK